MSIWFTGENINGAVKFYAQLQETAIVHTQLQLKRANHCIIEVCENGTWNIFWTVGQPIRELSTLSEH